MGKVIKTLENENYCLDLIDSETTGNAFTVRLWSKLTLRHVFWTEELPKKEANKRFRSSVGMVQTKLQSA